MAYETDFDLFRSALFLRGTTPAALHALWSMASVQVVGQGGVVMRPDRVSDDVFLVLSGTLLAFNQSPGGKAVVFDRLGAGRLCGLTGPVALGRRLVTVRSGGAARLARLPVAPFEAWLLTNPGALRGLLSDATDAQRDLADRFHDMAVHDLQTRVRLFLVRLFAAHGVLYDGGVLDPAPSHSLIAAHVGANREAVSRVLSRLNRAKVIVSGRQRIVIVDHKALQDGLA